MYAKIFDIHRLCRKYFVETTEFEKKIEVKRLYRFAKSLYFTLTKLTLQPRSYRVD